MSIPNRGRRRLGAALAGALLTMAAVAVTATPAAAATHGHVTPAAVRPQDVPPNGTWEIVSYLNGKCIGIQFHSTANGLAGNWSCTGGADQTWHRGSQLSNTGDYQIINGYGKCLGVSGGSASQGADIVGWSCLGSGHLDQYWLMEVDPVTGRSYWVNYQSGYVIGISGGSTANGAQLVQVIYQHHRDQLWGAQ